MWRSRAWKKCDDKVHGVWTLELTGSLRNVARKRSRSSRRKRILRPITRRWGICRRSTQRQTVCGLTPRNLAAWVTLKGISSAGSVPGAGETEGGEPEDSHFVGMTCSLPSNAGSTGCLDFVVVLDVSSRRSSFLIPDPGSPLRLVQREPPFPCLIAVSTRAVSKWFSYGL